MPLPITESAAQISRMELEARRRAISDIMARTEGVGIRGKLQTNLRRYLDDTVRLSILQRIIWSKYTHGHKFGVLITAGILYGINLRLILLLEPKRMYSNIDYILMKKRHRLPRIWLPRTLMQPQGTIN